MAQIFMFQQGKGMWTGVSSLVADYHPWTVETRDQLLGDPINIQNQIQYCYCI